QVKPDSKTNKYLKAAKPAVLDEIGKLAAGQMAYYAMHIDPEFGKVIQPLLSGMVGGDDDSGKAIKEALEQLNEASPSLYLIDTSLPLQSLTVVTYKDPAKAAEAQLKIYKSMKPGEGFQQALIKEKPKIKENAQTHRGFKLHYVSMTWDFEKMTGNAPV